MSVHLNCMGWLVQRTPHVGFTNLHSKCTWSTDSSIPLAPVCLLCLKEDLVCNTPHVKAGASFAMVVLYAPWNDLSVACTLDTSIIIVTVFVFFVLTKKWVRMHGQESVGVGWGITRVFCKRMACSHNSSLCRAFVFF